MDIQKEIQSLSPSAEVELFVLDTTMFEGGEVLRFHSGLSQVNQPIIWQGEAYQPIPIETSGFDLTSQGTLPRPTVRIANVGGVMSALAINMDDLTGAKFTRKRTFARYLDAINFPNGLNPEANPDQYFPDQLWYVDRKKLENKHQVEWELASPFDLDGIKLPLRQIVKNTCSWKYRSSECGYTGGYFDSNDAATADINQDTCPKRFASCKVRHNSINVVELPFGGFPGAERGD
ncbi:phage minor tail protein L [Acinetobacter brisouii]|uniref:phage minor tail protein L n=1 Tax=Acinetobacter brisouii TaxID=396323 RepID=UPI00124C17E9|nr:phage minor tail protein L [Acinetobacter brisouii]